MLRTATTALLVIFSSVSFAGDMNKEKLSHVEKLQKDFKAMDQDGNGLLTRSEVDANPKLVGTFIEIDLNDNNDVDMDEFVIYQSEATAAGKPKITREQQKDM